jgi:hypothetical protein
VKRLATGPGKAQVHYTITLDEFQGWLGAPPRPDRLRAYLMMLLRRIPPDRDFKRGLTVR